MESLRVNVLNAVIHLFGAEQQKLMSYTGDVPIMKGGVDIRKEVTN